MMKDLNFSVSDELHTAVKNLADKKGISMAELSRRVLKDAVTKDAAETGVDVITEKIRRIVRNEIRKESNRVASLNFKVGKAAATSMFLNYLALKDHGLRDAKDAYQSAQSKALIFMGEDEDLENL